MSKPVGDNNLFSIESNDTINDKTADGTAAAAAAAPAAAAAAAPAATTHSSSATLSFSFDSLMNDFFEREGVKKLPISDALKENVKQALIKLRDSKSGSSGSGSGGGAARQQQSAPDFDFLFKKKKKCLTALKGVIAKSVEGGVEKALGDQFGGFIDENNSQYKRYQRLLESQGEKLKMYNKSVADKALDGAVLVFNVLAPISCIFGVLGASLGALQKHRKQKYSVEVKMQIDLLTKIIAGVMDRHQSLVRVLQTCADRNRADELPENISSETLVNIGLKMKNLVDTSLEIQQRLESAKPEMGVLNQFEKLLNEERTQINSLLQDETFDSVKSIAHRLDRGHYRESEVQYIWKTCTDEEAKKFWGIRIDNRGNESEQGGDAPDAAPTNGVTFSDFFKEVKRYLLESYARKNLGGMQVDAIREPLRKKMGKKHDDDYITQSEYDEALGTSKLEDFLKALVPAAEVQANTLPGGEPASKVGDDGGEDDGITVNTAMAGGTGDDFAATAPLPTSLESCLSDAPLPPIRSYPKVTADTLHLFKHMGANAAEIDKRIQGALITAMVQKCFRCVPRDYFLPVEAKTRFAYFDRPYICYPYVEPSPSFVAVLLHETGVHCGVDSFLCIGSGSGYINALVGVASDWKGMNHGFDLDERLIQNSKESMQSYTEFCKIKPHNVEFTCGDALAPPRSSLTYQRVCCLQPVAIVDVLSVAEFLECGGRGVVRVRLDEAADMDSYRYFTVEKDARGNITQGIASLLERFPPQKMVTKFDSFKSSVKSTSSRAMRNSKEMIKKTKK